MAGSFVPLAFTRTQHQAPLILSDSLIAYGGLLTTEQVIEEADRPNLEGTLR
jgi:hypothetical protein